LGGAAVCRCELELQPEWLWLLSALISAIFPLITARPAGYPFVFFSAITALQFGVLLRTDP
jgi:hypothetical protein